MRREQLRLERENVRLRHALQRMLEEAEAMEMDSNWWAAWPKPARLCGMLARYIRSERGGGDLERYKRARRALGLPWWGGLEYRRGIQPGRGA